MKIRAIRTVGFAQPMIPIHAGHFPGELELLLVVAQADDGTEGYALARAHGGQSAAVDDGEPSGTAGRPMLDVLRHQDLEGVLATVVRYFGGVKLGAGGLVRAYTDAVAQALLQAEKVPIVRLATLRCVVPYAMEGLLRRELDAAGASLLAVVHGQAVELCFSLPEEAAVALRARLGEAGQGRIEWLPVPDEVA